MVLFNKLSIVKNSGCSRNFVTTLISQNAATTILNTNELPVNSNIQKLENDWKNNPRWSGIKRNYNAKDVLKLRTSIKIDHSIAKYGADRLWKLLSKKDEVVTALGALTGNQAVQQVKAGLKAIYLSGWQVAADANLSGDMYPDLSLYPSNSVPNLVRNINKALARADQIDNLEGKTNHDWFTPIIADAEAGFGGVLNSYELMKSMIEAGAAGVHFEDQLTSAKKCGHMNGKVLVPTSEAISKLQAARLASDVLDIPTVLIARTDAQAANLLTSDIDPNDKKFIISSERSSEGFFKTSPGLSQSISRGIAYAPYADLIWCETSTPDLEFAKKFAEAIKKEYPNKMLAYNCSPSFNWKLNLNEQTIAKFQKELCSMGYKFQFITLAGFHTLNYSMFNLAYEYAKEGMPAFVKLQQNEFKASERGFTAFKHQSEVGTSFFDEIISLVQERKSSTLALKGSTEDEQFFLDDLIKEQNVTNKQF